MDTASRTAQQHRRHILHGVRAAMLHPQAVLGAVTTATTPDTALAAVMATPLGSEGLYLDHAQARAVLDLRVHRFCAEQVQLIEDELAEIITGESAAGP